MTWTPQIFKRGGPHGSGCLIDAIVCHDERRLRHLLSDASAKFSDTYWMRRESLLIRIAIFKPSIRGFRTTQWSKLAELDAEHCTHPVLAETLAPGKPANIAVSVALMSMLHTSGHFNLLQVLVDSRKFDLSEPLLFHMPIAYGLPNSWSLVAVDPIEFALLIDRGSDFDDPKSFPLLKTLLCSSRLHLNSNADMRMMELSLDWYSRAHWEALRAKGALSFLCGYRRYGFHSFKRITCGFCSFHDTERHKLLLSLLKALCRMGLTLNADTPPAYCYKRKDLYGRIYSSTFLEVLIEMFDMHFWNSKHKNKERYVSEWLCNGWICAQRNDWTCMSVLARHSSDGNVHFRILRQLLALGLFRDADNEQFWSAYCEDCFVVTQATLVTHRQCPRLAPLVDEFFRKPLSLLQLSRMEIRRLVGMNDFKDRMETLQKLGLLPPLLFKYVWRANEMLVDVARQ